MLSDDIQLLVQAIHEPAQCIAEEAVEAVRPAAGAVEFAVVARPRQVVVVAEQVAGGLRQAGFEQDGQLQQTPGAPVAVPERMDPHEVDVREDRLDDGERGGLDVRRREIVKHRAQALQQELGVAPLRAAVATDDHVARAHAAGRHAVVHVQPVQHAGVHPFDVLDREVDAPFLLQLVAQLLAGGNNVVEFALEVLAGRRQLEQAGQGRPRFVLRERVPLDGGSGKCAFGKVERVDVVGDLRRQRRVGDLPALGDRFTQRKPVRVLQPAQIEVEREPRMRPLVWPLLCHASCPRSHAHQPLTLQRIPPLWWQASAEFGAWIVHWLDRPKCCTKVWRPGGADGPTLTVRAATQRRCHGAECDATRLAGARQWIAAARRSCRR